MQGNYTLSSLLDFLTGISLITISTVYTYGPKTATLSCCAIGFLILVLHILYRYTKEGMKIRWAKALKISNILGGLFLAFSPWLLDFSNHAYVPQLILGSSTLLLELLFKRRFKEEVYMVDQHLSHGH